MRKAIPVKAASALALQYGFDQVIIVARRVGEGESVTTYGKGRIHKDIAARTGEYLQREVMGWARENTVQQETLPSRGVRRPKDRRT